MINAKQYIGQSINVKRRIRGHKWQSKQPPFKKDYPIHSALKKYGIDNFDIQIIECDIGELDELEISLIQELNTISPNGYNLETGGNKNKKLSEKTKQKMSKSQTGKQHSDKTRQILSEINKGKKLTDDTIKKMSQAQKGRKHSEETKEKISKINKGRKNSKESIDKMSLKLRGRTLSYNHKKNISKAFQGEKHPCSKLTEKDVIKIKYLIRDGMKDKEIAHRYNIHRSTIGHIRSGKNWKHIKID